MKYLVLGDIHNEYKSLMDAHIYAQENNLTIISVGDVVDYGPNPVEVIHQTVKDAIEHNEIHSSNSQLAMSMILGAVLQVAVSSIYGRLPGKLSVFKTELHEAIQRMLKP